MKSLVPTFALLALGVAATLLVAKAWLEWTDENNTRSADRILSAEQLHALPPPEKAQEPILVRLDDQNWALVNPTRTPIRYTGYTIHGFTNRPPRGEIHPFFEIQVLDEKGQWGRQGRGWCGTGAGTLAVLPGQAGRFRVQDAGNGKVARIGVDYWRGDPRRIQTIWSEPIRP